MVCMLYNRYIYIYIIQYRLFMAVIGTQAGNISPYTGHIIASSTDAKGVTTYAPKVSSSTPAVVKVTSSTSSSSSSSKSLRKTSTDTFQSAVASGEIVNIKTGAPINTTSSSDKSLRKKESPVNSAERAVIKEEKTKHTMPVYTKIDTVLGGYLPGGVSPTEVKTKSLIKDTTEKTALNDAKINAQLSTYDYEIQRNQMEVDFNAELTAIKEQQDIVKKSWYENLGLFRSDSEKAYQEAVIRQQGLNALTNQIPNTAIAYDAYANALKSNPSYSSALSVPLVEDTSFLSQLGSGLKTTGNYLLIGGAVVLGVMLLRNK